MTVSWCANKKESEGAMLTVQGIASLLSSWDDADLPQKIYTAILTGGTQQEIQEWLEHEGVVMVGDTTVSDAIFAELAPAPPLVIHGRDGNPGQKGDPGPTGDKGDQGLKGRDGDSGDPGPKGDRGPAGPSASISWLVAVIVVIVVIAAGVYIVDSHRVDERIDAAKAEMPKVAGVAAKAKLKAAFGEEFLAAAPTWAKPTEPECSWGQFPTVGDCMAQKSEACAMRCCAYWAQQPLVLGAQCRLEIRNALLGQPAPYPPPPPPKS